LSCWQQLQDPDGNQAKTFAKKLDSDNKKEVDGAKRLSKKANHKPCFDTRGRSSKNLRIYALGQAS